MAGLSRFLVRVDVGGSQTTFEYDQRTISIGSGEGNEIVLPHESVEAAHARIHFENEPGYEAFVHEEPLGEFRAIADGTAIQLGAYTLTLSTKRAVEDEATRDAQARFLSRIRERPNDDDTRLVYRDWLLENDYEERALYLDTMVRLVGLHPDSDEFQSVGRELRTIGEAMPLEWRRAVGRAPIDNCDVRFELVCPKRWDELRPTKYDDERFCGGCNKTVHYAATLEQARGFAQLGKCIAIDPPERHPLWRREPTPDRGRMGVVVPWDRER